MVFLKITNAEIKALALETAIHQADDNLNNPVVNDLLNFSDQKYTRNESS